MTLPSSSAMLLRQACTAARREKNLCECHLCAGQVLLFSFYGTSFYCSRTCRGQIHIFCACSASLQFSHFRLEIVTIVRDEDIFPVSPMKFGNLQQNSKCNSPALTAVTHLLLPKGCDLKYPPSCLCTPIFSSLVGKYLQVISRSIQLTSSQLHHKEGHADKYETSALDIFKLCRKSLLLRCEFRSSSQTQVCTLGQARNLSTEEQSFCAL